MPAAPSSPLAVFRHRNFRLLWLAQFVSAIGSGIASIAAAILVYRETDSALSVGIVLLVNSLPGLLVGLVAGVYVDRYDRKKIMIAADLLCACVMALIPLLLPFGTIWLYVLLLLASALEQFFEPALESVLPETTPEDELATANSMMTVSSVGASTIGFALAGLIAVSMPLVWAFYLDAASYVVSALCIALVRVKPIEAPENTSVGAVLTNLRAGLRYIKQTPVLRSLFTGFAPIFVIFGLQLALLLPFATRALGASEFEYSLIEGVGMIGFVLGSLAMANVVTRLHEGQWISLSILAMGLLSIWFASLASVPSAILVYVLYNLCNAPSYIGRRLVIQRNTPRELRGRTNSAFLVLRDTGYMVGMFGAGLADVVDARTLYVLSGVALVVAGVYTLVLPGLGQPSAEWRRIMRMLRSIPDAPGLGLGRAAVLADIELLAGRLPVIATLSLADRRKLAEAARLFEAPEGTAVVRQGSSGTAVYFLLDGRTVASRQEASGERVLEVHSAGDFFGEIAAITREPRTANVVTVAPSTLLQVPAPVLLEVADEPELQRVLFSKMVERMLRMDMIETPRMAGLDQQLLRELRTNAESANGASIVQTTT
jgi:CRP-like cAMP-binding protein/Na+/melibiose symporter-like transporter